MRSPAHGLPRRPPETRALAPVPFHATNVRHSLTQRKLTRTQVQEGHPAPDRRRARSVDAHSRSNA
eukprot:5170809-Pyramimonas_sp.AAC.1